MKKIVFSDFDGTLTLGAHLSPHFFEILDLCRQRDMELVIVTGRSISWSHFFLTHFPLQACITEGGGAITYRDEKHRLCEDLLVTENRRRNLQKITDALLEEFPMIELSVDSFGRKTDRAIELHDIAEDSRDHLMDKITGFLTEQGAQYNCSNVHLNFWSGEMSKMRAMEHFVSKYRSEVSLDDCLFFGDSLNDQSVFKDFKNCIGVSNISNYLDQMEFRPGTILQGEENRGAQGVLNYLKKSI